MNFVITGDSWSQGEWDGYPDDYRVTHSGIQQYLIDDGHTVTNVGQGGYNNSESVAAIADLKFDHLIFFYTDPLRQATEFEIQNDLPFNIIEAHKIMLHQKLLDAKHKNRSQITIVGGCAKYLGSTEDIDYVVPSITELLVNEFIDSEYMTSREWEHYFFIHEKNYSFRQRKQWLTVMEEASKKYQAWNINKNFFWPDGLHANRYGTKILYNKLQELWINE